MSLRDSLAVRLSRYAFGLAVLAVTNGIYPAYGGENPTDTTRFRVTNAEKAVDRTLSWIGDTNDNKQLPFALIDKKNAKIFVFQANGTPVASASVLLGIARLDRINPGTLNAKLGDITAEDRVTPAGRYRARTGRDLHGRELLWVDYDYAIAIHPVAEVAGQQRTVRLQSATPDDNRITWGCINASASFYKTVISPLFKPKGGIVYILPEEIAVEDYIGKGFR